MPSNTGVLSIEFKVNFLSPAIGEKFIGIGKVIKAGRTITVCSGEALAVENGAERLVAVMQATMMTVVKRYD
jgi:acyl-coenzyme A thioesterase PaaI-like protein